MAVRQVSDLEFQLTTALDERPEDQSRVESKAPDSIKAAEAQARGELRQRIVARLEELRLDEIRNSAAAVDKLLLPDFKKYCEHMFEAFAQAGRAALAGQETEIYINFLKEECIGGILGWLLPGQGDPARTERSGLWEMLLEDACRYLHDKGYFRPDWDVIGTWRRELLWAMRDSHTAYEFKKHLPNHLGLRVDRHEGEWFASGGSARSLKARSRRHGPKPALESHHRVAEIVHQTDRDDKPLQHRLLELCKLFGAAGVPPPRRREKDAPARESWEAMLSQESEDVKKAIAYHLAYTARTPPSGS